MRVCGELPSVAPVAFVNDASDVNVPPVVIFQTVPKPPPEPPPDVVP